MDWMQSCGSGSDLDPGLDAELRIRIRFWTGCVGGSDPDPIISGCAKGSDPYPIRSGCAEGSDPDPI